MSFTNTISRRRGPTRAVVGGASRARRARRLREQLTGGWTRVRARSAAAGMGRQRRRVAGARPRPAEHYDLMIPAILTTQQRNGTDTEVVLVARRRESAST